MSATYKVTEEITHEQIAAARSLVGLSQEELATLCEVNRATLSRVESGKLYSQEIVDRILFILQTEEGVVFFRNGVMKP